MQPRTRDFRVNARLLRRGLLDNGYTELPITSEHAINVDHLPSTHKDPFDRILVAQATVEGITLLTNDRKLAKLSGADTESVNDLPASVNGC